MKERTRPGDFVLGDAFARVLTETTQALVCVLDREGRILLFNDACVRATGFTREEALGQEIFGLVIPPEEAEAFREVLAFIFKSGHSSPQVGHWQTKSGGRRLIAWSNLHRPIAAAPRLDSVRSVFGSKAGEGQAVFEPFDGEPILRVCSEC